MKIEKDVSLRPYSTMRLGGNARYLAHVSDINELKEALEWADQNSQSVLPIGRGSNIVWSDEGYDGLVLVIGILGRENLGGNKFRFGAGEKWDEIVNYTVGLGLSGIETLSLIPGTAGATPVQNVGAYGSEIADVLIELEAYDIRQQKLVIIPLVECDFSYRSSRFKKSDKGRFIITSITLQLSTQNLEPPFYGALQNYLDQNNILDYSPQTIREAVIAIRSSKLPDPEIVANNGSFFANPIISEAKFSELKKSFPEIASWPMPNYNVKLAAGWLVEQAGFKGFQDAKTGMAVWPKQSLVLVNEHANSTTDLIEFRDRIVRSVEEKFGVKLEQEPELI